MTAHGCKCKLHLLPRGVRRPRKVAFAFAATPVPARVALAPSCQYTVSDRRVSCYMGAPLPTFYLPIPGKMLPLVQRQLYQRLWASKLPTYSALCVGSSSALSVTYLVWPHRGTRGPHWSPAHLAGNPSATSKNCPGATTSHAVLSTARTGTYDKTHGQRASRLRPVRTPVYKYEHQQGAQAAQLCMCSLGGKDTTDHGVQRGCAAHADSNSDRRDFSTHHRCNALQVPCSAFHSSRRVTPPR